VATGALGSGSYSCRGQESARSRATSRQPTPAQLRSARLDDGVGPLFTLVSRRYERASLIVTSNKAFSALGEIFGDEVVAAAMIDRLVHHAEIIATKGTQA
jgi:IstB-like ATP binding protein